MDHLLRENQWVRPEVCSGKTIGQVALYSTTLHDTK